jgi:hypothetical protein
MHWIQMQSVRIKIPIYIYLKKKKSQKIHLEWMIRIEGTNFKLVVVGSSAVGVPISLMFLILGVN